MKTLQIINILVFVLIAGDLFSTPGINDYYDNYRRYLELSGELEKDNIFWNSYSVNGQQEPVGIWADKMKEPGLLIDPELKGTLNTGYAWGNNDGAWWQGRGLNGQFSTGIDFNTEYFSLVLNPVLFYSMNSDYKLFSKYWNSDFPEGSWSQLDVVQRFGDSSITDFSFGQSSIRGTLNNWSLGFSTENIWLGPAGFNPILLSNNAEGFPHFDLSMDKTETFLGDFEFNVYWGSLSESDYFDNNPDNDTRFTTGLHFSYSPDLITGLSLGFARIAISEMSELTPPVFFTVFEPKILGFTDYGSDRMDQRASLFARWYFEPVNFEVYLEYSKNDFTTSLRNLMFSPEHSQAYTFGFKKSFPIDNKKGFLVNAELTQIIGSMDYLLYTNGVARFYSHHIVSQGHTNSGQNLGSWIGSGSNAQNFKIDFYDQWGMIGLLVSRVGYDLDYSYSKHREPIDDDARIKGNESPNEFTAGLNGVYLFKNFDIYGSVMFSYYMNKFYIKENDDINFHFEAGIRYKL